MIINNDSLLEMVDSALKGGLIEVSDLGQAILQPQKFDKFVRTIQEATVILPKARYIKMESHIVDIDRLSFIGRVFDSLEDAAGNERTLSTSEFAKPTFNTNKLIAKGMQAIVGIKDSTLRKNIEKGGLENTILDLLGEAGGRDLEEFALFADIDLSYAQDHILSKSNGWIKLAANAVYGAGANKDFDP
ncbi:MAG: phage major capsid protein, partial [Ignavibacteria bacterium]|nr:phage major capsid protein [Ignavibacteria bacterium]